MRIARGRLPVLRRHREPTISPATGIPTCCCATCRSRRSRCKDGEALVATVFDLFCANYGVDRGLGGDNVASDYDDDKPFTPAWAERITGVPRAHIIHVARMFATNAEKTNGRSMVILGAGLNHWYHMDMAYRGIINLLVLCGCIGQSGGGWSHYVGQEKLRPQTGWLPLAFALDWTRPPRQHEQHSFFYAHTDQWRYETLNVDEILSPTAPHGDWSGSLIDYNVRAERMGWLPSAPQLQAEPADDRAQAPRQRDWSRRTTSPRPFQVRRRSQTGCHDPDDPANWPRNMFVWRSNLLGSSGKGHEYFLKHLLGTRTACWARISAPRAATSHATSRGTSRRRKENSTCWSRSTSACPRPASTPTSCCRPRPGTRRTTSTPRDMHPFIHPLSSAVDPAWESRIRLGHLQRLRQGVLRIAPRYSGSRPTSC